MQLFYSSFQKINHQKIYISSKAPYQLISYLKFCGYTLIPLYPHPSLGPLVNTHPDVRMCKLGITTKAPIIFAPVGSLSPIYPGDIPYNAACTGQFFIHNQKYTAPNLLSHIPRNIKKIHVNQGYTKCSTLIVDESSIITYDQGIAKPCSAAGMDVLLIRPGYISLPGTDTGFIGGAASRIDKEVIFFGDLQMHPDAKKIQDFIEYRGLCCRSFPGLPLHDIGSIILSD